jgi:GNAT superfamily N-acetyltransferase
LDTWLNKYAWQNQRADMTSTYVTTEPKSGQLVGYYALSVAAISHIEAPQRAKRGVAAHPIPVVLIARLAVDRRSQGQRIGHHLFRDAAIRTVSLASEIGIRGLLVHAKDPEAARFYQACSGSIEALPGNPLHLFLLLKDIRAALRSATTA